MPTKTYTYSKTFNDHWIKFQLEILQQLKCLDDLQKIRAKALEKRRVYGLISKTIAKGVRWR